MVFTYKDSILPANDIDETYIEKQFASCNKIGNKSWSEIQKDMIEATNLSAIPEFNKAYSLENNKTIGCIASQKIINSIVNYNKMIDCINVHQSQNYTKKFATAQSSWTSYRNNRGSCSCSIWKGNRAENPCGSNSSDAFRCARPSIHWTWGGFECNCDCIKDYSMNPLCKPTKGKEHNQIYINMVAGMKPQDLIKIPYPNSISCFACSTNIGVIKNEVNNNVNDIKQVNNCITSSVTNNITSNKTNIYNIEQQLEDNKKLLEVRKQIELIRENNEKIIISNQKKLTNTYNDKNTLYNTTKKKKYKYFKYTVGVSYIIYSFISIVLFCICIYASMNFSNKSNNINDINNKLFSTL